MPSLTLHQRLGAGTMGTVYRGELRTDGGINRRVAVKVLTAHEEMGGQLEERLRDEARLLGLLADELIVGVADLVRLDGHWAVVMDLVHGADLAEIAAVGPIPGRALAELGAEVAGALYRAHQARHEGAPLGVVHRDIKPGNIMVTSLGGVRLLDFGVARAAFANREARTVGLVLGTLNYLAPETIAGDPPTPAVDVFGLGQTLWEAATGRSWGPPVPSRERFETRVQDHMARLPSGAEALGSVLRQMVQWDPGLRPDASALEHALLRAASSIKGPGLRTWARNVVPGVLTRRAVSETDDWVGRSWVLGAVEPHTVRPVSRSVQTSSGLNTTRVAVGVIVGVGCGTAAVVACSMCLAVVVWSLS